MKAVRDLVSGVNYLKNNNRELIQVGDIFINVELILQKKNTLVAFQTNELRIFDTKLKSDKYFSLSIDLQNKSRIITVLGYDNFNLIVTQPVYKNGNKVDNNNMICIPSDVIEIKE